MDGGNAMLAISCASVTLCVASDAAGNVVTTTNPTGGAGAWSIANVDTAEPLHYPNSIDGIDCPSTALCVAINDVGQVLSATNPTGGAQAWSVANVKPTQSRPGAVSCPTASMCVIVVDGQALTSKNPAGGAGAWTHASLNDEGTQSAVSCPSISFCVAVDQHPFRLFLPADPFAGGNVITSTNPTSGSGAWTSKNVYGVNQILTVSCTSGVLCVAGDTGGNVVTSMHPGASLAAWSFAHVDDTRSVDFGGTLSPRENAIACASPAACIAGDEAGNLLSSTDPTAGRTAWKLRYAANGTALSSDPVEQASCPRTNLCFAITYNADTYVERFAALDPTTAAPPSFGQIEPRTGYYNFNRGITALSCPSAALCVAVTPDGLAITSRHPMQTSRPWKFIDIDGNNYLNGLSCPTMTFCVATDGSSVLTSTNPTGGPQAWKKTPLKGQYAGQVSCASPSLCVITSDTVAGTGLLLVSTNPAGGASTWTVAAADPETLLTSLSCTATTICVAGDVLGNVLVGTGLPSPALVTVGPVHARRVKRVRARLTGTVNANGSAVTRCRFSYGSNKQHLVSVPCAKRVGAGKTPVAVSATIRGLRPGIHYRFWLVVRNAAGTVTSTAGGFTTRP